MQIYKYNACTTDDHLSYIYIYNSASGQLSSYTLNLNLLLLNFTYITMQNVMHINSKMRIIYLLHVSSITTILLLHVHVRSSLHSH